MTQEEKRLLLIDLCARLPYGVICRTGNFDGQLTLVCPNGDYCVLQNSPYAIETVKPYLRPMSSMTEEEYWETIDIKKGECNGCVLTGKGDPNTEFMLVDFYNKHHLDYRGLIPMGLALEAPEGMYKI